MNDPDPRRASDGFDQDAIFADIVAHLDGDETAPEPAAELEVEEATPDAEPADDPSDVSRPTPQTWRVHEVDDEDEEHFEPQPVAPLPVGDLQFWAIIAGMGGGPLLLLYLVLFDREAGALWILTAIGMSVGGFVLLVSRLPGNQGDDDGARL